MFSEFDCISWRWLAGNIFSPAKEKPRHQPGFVEGDKLSGLATAIP
jgi:hypothetical protein